MQAEASRQRSAPSWGWNDSPIRGRPSGRDVSISGSRRVSTPASGSPTGVRYRVGTAATYTARGTSLPVQLPAGARAAPPPRRASFCGDAMSWTDERIETLTRLWQDGLSASQIAMRLGGVTRNAVIAKVHRLGLAGRVTKKHKPYGRRPSLVPGHAVKAAKPPRATQRSILAGLPTSPLPSPQAADKATVSMHDVLDHHCRFPVGDFVSITAPYYCGDKIVLGLPYCEGHARRCYQPPQTKVRERDRHRPMEPALAARTRFSNRVFA